MCAVRASSTATNFFLVLIYCLPSRSIQLHFFNILSLPYFLTALVWARAVSHVGPRNKNFLKGHRARRHDPLMQVAVFLHQTPVTPGFLWRGFRLLQRQVFYQRRGFRLL